MYSRDSGRQFRRLVPLRLPGDRLLEPLDWAGDDDDDDCVSRWCAAQWDEDARWRLWLCSRPGRALIVCSLMFLVYLIALALSTSRSTTVTAIGEFPDDKPRAGINISRAVELLTDLCESYDRGLVSGDSCNRLCYDRKWTVTDYYEGNKIVIVLKDGGQTAVYKSKRPFIEDFPSLDGSLSYDQYTDKVLDLINDELRLGWPRHYKRHLLETVWPTQLRTPGETMSMADRRSLWALLQQSEFILFRILPLTRVTPKIIGTCGSFYQTESLVAFRMKGYYMNLKGKILVHVMGTLKLLYEFLNEPLQWCDVQFDNLGLSADYPKRFVMMDGDELYTKSRLDHLLKTRPCATDSDCIMGDCQSRCLDTMTCSGRTNENLEVFCDKLVNKLFGNTWSKNNQYLLACHDTTNNVTQRLTHLRLQWSWNLPDV